MSKAFSTQSVPVPERDESNAARRRAVAVAGHTRDEATARAALVHPAHEVRASALGALARIGALRPEDVSAALADPAPEVRRRACDLAGRLQSAILGRDLTVALNDSAPTVVEAACYALGELYALGGLTTSSVEVVRALARTATTHAEPLCREAAVAALGSVGCDAGLPAVIAGLKDKPAIRRRAVVALAAFDGTEVDSALARATTDPDWQVRQAAEDLVGRRPRPS